MVVFDSLSEAGYYVKSRPDKYSDPDNVFGTVGGNSGVTVARKPKDYPLTDQQKAVKNAAQECDIEAGMDRGDLKDKMKNCIPGEF